MRAGMVLRALARDNRVSLLVVPLYPSPAGPLPAELVERCRQVEVVPPGAPVPQPTAKVASGPDRWLRRVLGGAPGGLREEPFEVIHVFRLAMLPYARPWLEHPSPRPRRQLDLDDFESATRRRIAALYRLNADPAAAGREAAAAARAEELEAEVLRTFDRVYVCSEADRRALAGRGPAEVCLLPNALPVPAPLSPKRGDGPFTFLFVGTLGYYPNEDAALYFGREVLPLVRRRAGREVRVNVVGTGAGEALAPLAALPEVRLIGAVPDVAPWYRDADAVIVPIRAGGGTRIKTLEAFGYQRPVVTTSVGIEGIEARTDEHVLLGDTPALFAEQCLRLMADPDLAASLAREAFALFTQAYSFEAFAQRVA